MSLWGLGTRVLDMCTGRRLWTFVAQPCKLPWLGRTRNQTWWTVQVRTAQAPQSPGSHCQDCAGAAEPRFPLPAPVHTSLPSAGMHHFRIRLRHPRNVPCFPWCVLWERRGNSHPRCRPHTWVAAGVDKPPCQLCPWSSGALAVQCHLPGKVAWGVLGAEIKERGVCKGWVPVFLSTHLS